MLYYLYNGEELLGLVYNGSTYYYHKNVFGDIIGILNHNYEEIVTYEYDSWGAISSIADNSGINLGTINPFRYRSYYYDEETKLYYLNSRYYNPEWGRFINGDGTVSTGQGFIGNNMFNYCGNNPIVRADDGGSSWFIVFGLVVAGCLGGGIAMHAHIQTNILLGSDNPYSGASGAFMSIVSPNTMLANVIVSSISSTMVNVFYEKANISSAVESLPLDIIMNYGISQYTSNLGGGTGSGDFLLDSWSGTTLVNINNNLNKIVEKEVQKMIKNFNEKTVNTSKSTNNSSSLFKKKKSNPIKKNPTSFREFISVAESNKKSTNKMEWFIVNKVSSYLSSIDVCYY